MVDYREALAVATEVAVEAAEILRAECALPTGPRGVPGKCPADDAAEAVIRRRLLEAFPEWGYRGEETDPDVPPRDPDGPVWLVDPNDGTRAMQRGYRGHAVSIGLVRGGSPVLGVVHAPDAPDDAGEVFAWAEGCGPLTRNGIPVERPRWPDVLGPNDVVLLSQAGDRHPAGNLACVAPGRFRDVPSIAYRLALAAAGEGVVGVSLNGPGDWDYAAGHALLRGAGGTLLDQDGREVTYTREGRSWTSCCFGGSPAVAQELAARDWSRASRSGFGEAVPAPGYEPARLVAGQLVHDVGLLRRAQGCLLGQLAGDALGSLVEFQGPEQIAARYPEGPRFLEDGGTWDTIAGQPTDDSELALLLARSLVQRGCFDQEAVAVAYGRWFHGWPHSADPEPCGHAWCRPFDVGGTTAQALGAITLEAARHGGAARPALAVASRSSQANGALMRVSPLGIWGWDRGPADLAEAARQDARLTHPHPVCQEASALFVVTIAHAIKYGTGPEATYERALTWARQACTEPDVARAVERAAASPPADYLHQQGWVLTALQNAFFQLLHAAFLEEGVVQTVRAGGDTDTNAAIAGALLGAVHGRESVPAQWRRMVLSCRPMAGHPHVHKPRPAMLWPADALVLAERLLTSGSSAPNPHPSEVESR